MRRFGNRSILLASLTLIVGLVSAGTGPLLRLSTREIDFGRVDQFQMVAQDITIRNEGDAPLQILKVSADCGCTAGALTDSTIVPGGSATLNISFRTGSRKGEQRKKVTLQTNDPAEPKAIIRVLADVRPLVRVSRERVRFPEIRRGETATERVRIASDKGLGFQVLGIEGQEDLLEVAISPDPSTDEDAFWIDLKIRPDAPAGVFRRSVLLKTSGPKAGESRILVSGTIVSYFVVEGDTRIRFPVVRFGERTEVPIRVSCDGSKPYRLVGIESPVPYITAKITEGENHTYFVNLILKETAPAGRFRETVELKTTDPEQPVIAFDILGRVRR